MKIFSHLLLVLFLLVSFDCNAQRKKSRSQASNNVNDTLGNIIVKMKNGDEYKGIIKKKDALNLLLQTENGDLNLLTANVVSIEIDEYKGEFKFSNQHDTRYFYGPTAIPLKKGKGYYQNIELSSNTINYGLTNNVSVGGGFELLSLIYGKPFWTVTPKVGFKVTDKAYAGGGLLIAGIGTEGAGFLPYGVVTLGNSESNFTIGGGYGFAFGEDDSEKVGILTLGGTHRLSNSIAILSENYILPTIKELSYFGIHGIRILSPKNAFDLGLILIPALFGDANLPVLPYVGYARAF